MQQTKKRYTTADLLAIFDVSRSSLNRHLSHHHLQSTLTKQHHIQRQGRRVYFDATAVLMLADTFIHNSKKRSAESQSSTKGTTHDVKLKKRLDVINEKLDLIMKHLGMSIDVWKPMK